MEIKNKTCPVCDLQHINKVYCSSRCNILAKKALSGCVVNNRRTPTNVVSSGTFDKMIKRNFPQGGEVVVRYLDTIEV